MSTLLLRLRSLWHVARQIVAELVGVDGAGLPQAVVIETQAAHMPRVLKLQQWLRHLRQQQVVQAHLQVSPIDILRVCVCVCVCMCAL